MTVTSDLGPQERIAAIEPDSLRAQEPVEIGAHRKYPLITDPRHKDVAEMFAVLRTRLLTAKAKSGITSVLVSSAQAQEGKSFVCVNLALSVSQLCRDRVLLVDGDLRRGGITKLFGLSGSSGLADYLEARDGFDGCVRETTSPGLWVTPAGNLGENSLPTVLEGPRWPEFLERAAREYAMVIVDSVPVCAPIADFELLLSGCDAALLVVKLRKTTREALNLTSQRLNGKLLGVVVNNTEVHSKSEKYYYAGKGRKNP
ncbi:MAG TPA: CpsD/CapB family tyrosine-protein kinase [Candidatus Binatia bacterium]|nr:CpsD/CapB family tyrosine-protein kinase [Candidatus Binatia bacterium]